MRYFPLLLLGLVLFSCSQKEATFEIRQSEFIYETASFPECHASTMEELPDGRLIAAWFGGTEERNPDVGIWSSIYQQGAWSEPVLLADGVQNDTLRYPCWNPVLYQWPGGRLSLYYKVGPSPSTWWGMEKSSNDGGATWAEAKRLPEGILGPIKNKPVEVAPGVVISPSSTEGPEGWKSHVEISKDQGATWQRVNIDHASDRQVIQPTILLHPGGRIQVLCRSKHDRLYTSWSEDQGQTWSPLEATALLNPNAGADGVTLADGRQLLVYNPTLRGEEWSHGRNKLAVGLSDDGVNWRELLLLEDQPEGEFSYPAVIQTKDGRIHITYTWKREKVRHAVL